MKQNCLTIVSPVHPARAEALDELLTRLGKDVAGQTTIPFEQLQLLHFASWVIFRSQKSGTQLVFESNFDGDPDAFLGELTTRAKAGLLEIYRHCADFSEAMNLREYLVARIVPTQTFYVGCVGHSRDRIREEQDLHDRIEGFLDTLPCRNKLGAGEIRRRIQEFVRSEPQLAWALQPPKSPTIWNKVGFWLPLVLLVAVLVLIVFLLWYLVIPLLVLMVIVLRIKETADISEDRLVPEQQHDRHLASREDHRAQNHLASITVVKTGIFRQIVIRLVLTVINLAARYIFNKGQLAGISSIHFARWAILNGGHDLLFLSNFDGSWEQYLGEFIDHATNGLTAVWSNTRGFPKTRFLIRDGARDEQKFKAYARNAQSYTQLWYSAYAFSTVFHIKNNAAIREQLWTNLEEPGIQAWLRRF